MWVAESNIQKEVESELSSHQLIEKCRCITNFSDISETFIIYKEGYLFALCIFICSQYTLKEAMDFLV